MVQAVGDERLPALVAEPKAFLGCAARPRAAGGRLMFLGHTAQADFYMKQDTAERGFWRSSGGPPLLTYAELRARSRRLLALADWGDFGIRNSALPQRSTTARIEPWAGT